jgi:hypothetical protein
LAKNYLYELQTDELIYSWNATKVEFTSPEKKDNLISAKSSKDHFCPVFISHSLLS